MGKQWLSIVLPALFCFGPITLAATEHDLHTLMERAALRDTIRSRNDSALIDESTAVEQSRTQARTRSDYGLELRPSISDNDAGLALRIYLPDRWNKSRLREQLAVAAQSEQLRVAALEWMDIISVYRDFCSYRLLKKQLALTENELRFIEPYLEQADRSVELSQLSVSDRARLYSTYLALLNDHNDLTISFLEAQRSLMIVLGPNIDLENLSLLATIAMPSQLEIQSMLRTALEKRADYQRLGADIRAMQLAEEAANIEDGFHLKYIQPAYNVDYEDGSQGWELSASIVLPWGTHNPDIAVYQQQQALSIAAQAQQRKIIEERLRVLLNMAASYYAQAASQNQRIKPVIERLNEDMELMADVPLAQIRERLSIRERLLDASLQSAEAEYRTESLAVDLAEELGGW